ncbi:MAG: hypothetical protein JWQ97_990 [Phenylobacterium sp.]|nr:hypothetical protein [Phenylobacterium sp.]
MNAAKQAAALARWAAHPWVPCADKETLSRLYVQEVRTQKEIAEHLGVSPKAVETAMRRFNIPRRTAAKRNQIGTASPTWKGPAAGYQAKHLRVQTLRGAPQQCEQCGTRDPAKTYDWANLTGNYDDPNDFARMCRSCHRKYDNARR